VLYDLAWHLGLSHPIGLGWGGYANYAPANLEYPHDIVLEVFAEAGWLAAASLVLWIGYVWARARRRANDFEGMASLAVLTFMLMNALVSGDINDNRTFFLAIGLAIANSSLGLRKQRPTSQGEPAQPSVSVARPTNSPPDLAEVLRG
jgi:O-antigen ligase